jgi:hypothetical protein
MAGFPLLRRPERLSANRHSAASYDQGPVTGYRDKAEAALNLRQIYEIRPAA